MFPLIRQNGQTQWFEKTLSLASHCWEMRTTEFGGLERVRAARVEKDKEAGGIVGEGQREQHFSRGRQCNLPVF